MDMFTVQIHPPVDTSQNNLRDPLKSDDINAIAIYRSIKREFDIEYIIAEMVFKYYPSHALTALMDLNYEWELCRQKKDHEVTLSGYPIIDLKFDVGEAIFRDIVWPNSVIGRVNIINVENELRKATSQMWNVVRKISPESL